MKVSTVTEGLNIEFNDNHETISIEGKDETSVTATNIDLAKFTDQTGLSVYFQGFAGAGSERKTISFLGQVIGHSPDSYEYPYIWTMVNDIDTNPRSNPWVWSGYISSEDMIAKVKSCSTTETVVVPAGRFNTCVNDNGGEKIWYGNAPLYRIVKYEKVDGVRPSIFLPFLIFGSRSGIAETAAISPELSHADY